MNRKLKLIAFVITVLMLLSMVSCSHGEDGDTSSTQSTTAEQPAIPEHHHEQTAKPVYDPDASCSIFIYMCGSNLESKSGLAGKDIDELLKADIPDKVNVVIETGGAAKWRSHDIANDKLQRYIVKNALYEKTYSVNIIPASDGTATTDKQSAATGETVYIFPEPADGYEVDTIIVQGRRYEYGNFVYYEDAIKPDEKGDYKFVMQESSTEVRVTFKKSPNHVYISDSIENGTVLSDKETADESDTVTITIAPSEGFALKTLLCKKQDGTELELTKVDDAHYTFLMPDESVFVSAEFDFSDGDGILVGHTLSLKGNIGVNFYMDLDESVANSDTAYMYFTIPGDTVTYQKVYVNEQPDASLPHAEQKTVGDKTYYVLTNGGVLHEKRKV